MCSQSLNLQARTVEARRRWMWMWRQVSVKNLKGTVLCNTALQSLQCETNHTKITK